MTPQSLQAPQAPRAAPGRRGPSAHPLAGDRVLITGGGSGIGRLMALEASGRGAEVIVWDLDAAAADQTVAAVAARGGTARAVRVNVADRAEVARAAGETGPVDVVVNNAGVVTGARLLEASEESIQRTMEVNVLALYWVTRAFLGGMIERGHGTVVTVASAAGWTGVAGQTDYAASKWAAVGFTESLRNELRADGHRVRTLVVCPYYVDTGMFEGVRTRYPRLLPILRPEDVARQVVEAIESGRELVAMPPLVRWVPVLRALPVRAFDRVLDVVGVNQTMDHFVGRGRADQPPAKGGSTSTRESARTG